MQEQIKTFTQLLDRVKKKKRKTLAICCAEGRETVQAAKMAEDEGILNSVLIGNKQKIETICKEVGVDLSKTEIVDEKNPELTPQVAVTLVKEKKADMLMKGKVSTAGLLKAVLDKERGLRSGKLLSHVAVIEVENYPKLMLVTDGGINIRPDVTKKVEILLNAVEVAKKLGIEKPKAACLTAVETVNPDMPETIDASVITKMAEREDIKDVTVDGPLAFDVAVDKKSAQIKGIDSLIAGDTDIFLVPDIACGNIMVKALIYMADAKVGGIVVGGGAPIVLLSRSDTAQMKLYSMALGAAIC